MSKNPPYATDKNPLGLLDIRPALRTSGNLSAPTAKNLKNKNLPPLSYLLMVARLGELYETVFPNNPDCLDEEVGDWHDIETIGENIEEFLTRVNRIIPVRTDLVVNDMDIINWHLYAIPVVTQGFDLWDNGWDEFYEPSPYLLYMMHDRDSIRASDNPDEFTQNYPNHSVPDTLQPENLVQTLRQMNLPDPLNGLPDLICMLNKSTGNYWLDWGEVEIAESGIYPTWDGGEMECLADEWRLAVPVCDRVHALLGWHNDTPAAIERKIATIHQTLLNAYHLAGNATQIEMEFAKEAICDPNNACAPTPALAV